MKQKDRSFSDGLFFSAQGVINCKRLLNQNKYKVVFGVGFAVLLPVFWELDGVLFSMPVSDVLTFVFAIILISHTYKELNMKEAKFK